MNTNKHMDKNMNVDTNMNKTINMIIVITVNMMTHINLNNETYDYGWEYRCEYKDEWNVSIYICE